jgi:enoyl-CoA hydratase/carnithine racemase
VPETILTERRDEVLLITLNRPERLNAWTVGMGQDLRQAIGAANADPAVGAVVVTGAGRGFCAGADIQATFAGRIESQGGSEGSYPYDWVDLCLASKPLIAAVNGVCIGVGLTQILSFDAIVASDQARFGIGFIRIGLVPELAATRFLTQRMGPGRARLFALSGDLWPAADADAAGLVDRVVPHDELLDHTLDVAGRIAANPAPQLLYTKDLLATNATESDVHRVQEREFEYLKRCYGTAEHAEAVRAFAEKRPPRFPPRGTGPQ